MFRPGVGVDMAAIKHVIATKLLHLARKLPQGSLDFSPAGLSARSVVDEDTKAARQLQDLAATHAQAGQKLGVQEALKHIGVWAQYRHDRTRFEALHKAVRQLRRSRVAARRARRRHAST
jgi:hypothetical protein